MSHRPRRTHTNSLQTAFFLPSLGPRGRRTCPVPPWDLVRATAEPKGVTAPHFPPEGLNPPWPLSSAYPTPKGPSYCNGQRPGPVPPPPVRRGRTPRPGIIHDRFGAGGPGGGPAARADGVPLGRLPQAPAFKPHRSPPVPLLPKPETKGGILNVPENRPSPRVPTVPGCFPPGLPPGKATDSMDRCSPGGNQTASFGNIPRYETQESPGPAKPKSLDQPAKVPPPSPVRTAKSGRPALNINGGKKISPYLGSTTLRGVLV